MYAENKLYVALFKDSANRLPHLSPCSALTKETRPCVSVTHVTHSPARWGSCSVDEQPACSLTESEDQG